MSEAASPSAAGAEAGAAASTAAASARADAVSSHPPVRMYTTAVCPYCIRAERYLRAHGVADIDMLRVDVDPALRLAMMQKTGRRTVPQIYIGDVHVGGYEDLVALDREGKLDPLLAPA